MQIPAVDTADYHTGGEPFRIVAEPPVPIPGDCVADRRARAIADPVVDGLRQVLCFEPRGHAGMYGCFITPPDDARAVIPAVTGMAYRYGSSQFTVDPRDPLVPGFVLR